MSELDPAARALEHGRQAPGAWACLTLGAQLRALRKHLGLSQAAVAEKSGLNQAAVSRAERGIDVHWSTLERLCAVYGCRPLLLPHRGYPVMTPRQAHDRAIVEDIKRSWDAKLRAKGFRSP